jgi:hypothetical protein
MIVLPSACLTLVIATVEVKLPLSAVGVEALANGASKEKEISNTSSGNPAFNAFINPSLLVDAIACGLPAAGAVGSPVGLRGSGRLPDLDEVAVRVVVVAADLAAAVHRWGEELRGVGRRAWPRWALASRWRPASASC